MSVACGSIAPRSKLSARPGIVAASALALLTLFAYLPALRAQFIWDDDAYVTENPTLTTGSGLAKIWLDPRATPQYYPLVHTSFWVEYHLWGLKPVGYHVTNLLLHIGVALLLWRILLRLQIPGAFLAACVFAVYPVHVESVAWVTERKNVLSGLFYLAAMHVYLFRVARNEFSWRAYAAALLLFLAALLSKSVTCSLPAAILLILWWKHGRLAQRDILLLVPMFALGLAMALATAWLERTHVGAVGKDFAFLPIDRVLIAGRALWFYAAKLVWPANLTFIYPKWRIDAYSIWQYAFPLATAGAIIALWLLRHRIGRGPIVAALLFCGTLLPALGFVNVYPMRYSFVADHFQYLASIALIVALIAGITIVCQRMNHVKLGALASSIVVILFAVHTNRQSRIYFDRQTLWQDTLAKNPDCWMAHNNLAFCLLQKNDLDAAMQHANESLRLRPDHAEAHNTLGRIYARMDRPDDAIAEYREALRLKPTLASAQLNWGTVLGRRGQSAEAAGHFEAAARINPRYADAFFNWGSALAAQGKQDQAMEKYRRALSIAPTHLRANLGLADLLHKRGDDEQAVECCEMAARHHPDSAAALDRLAVLLYSSIDPNLRDMNRAVQLTEKACDITVGDDADMLFHLAQAYSSAGKTSEAERAVTRAIAAADAFGRTDMVQRLEKWRTDLKARDSEIGAARD